MGESRKDSMVSILFKKKIVQITCYLQATNLTAPSHGIFLWDPKLKWPKILRFGSENYGCEFGKLSWGRRKRRNAVLPISFLLRRLLNCSNEWFTSKYRRFRTCFSSNFHLMARITEALTQSPSLTTWVPVMIREKNSTEIRCTCWWANYSLSWTISSRGFSTFAYVRIWERTIWPPMSDCLDLNINSISYEVYNPVHAT